jgi:hypothetical protein
MSDKKLGKYLLLLLFFPLALGMCSSERFRYPCQDPANWDKDICQKPLCDVTRTCPEHIFKGQRDPRLGPPVKDEQTKPTNTTPDSKGANCGK